MKIERILVGVPEDVDGKPIFPGFPVIEGADRHYLLLGPGEDAPAAALNKTTRSTVARAWKERSGRYAVAAEPDVMERIDLDSKGMTMDDYSKTPAASDWSVKNGTSCAISSISGPDDPRLPKAHPVQPLVDTGPYKPPEDPSL